MRIFIDLDTSTLIPSPGFKQEVTSLSFKRSPFANIEVQFTRSGTVIELPVDATGIWGVKAAGQFDADYVTAALAWVKTGTGEDTVYTFIFTFITAALDALFGVDPISPVVFTAATNDLITSVAHGLSIGNPIRFSTTNALPGGLTSSEPYYVVATGFTVDAFKVSRTLGGSIVDITNTGTGTQTWNHDVTDLAEITLMGELQWMTGGSTFKTPTLDVVVANDVNRGGEVVPETLPIVYAVFLPAINNLTDFAAIPTAGLILGYLVEILVVVAGDLSWLTYRLETGPTTTGEPGQVEPDDYNLTTNNRHWRGAVGPSGPGLAMGGAAGTALVKVDGTDFNTTWSKIGLSNITNTVKARLNLSILT